MDRRWILVFLSIVALTWSLGCSESTDEGDPALSGEAQFQAMYDAAVDYFAESAPKVVEPATISANLVSDPEYYTVLDTRAASDFALGHIEGAHNINHATALEDILAIPGFGTKPIIVSCYSGQTAGWVVAALNILGYDASSMKWAHSGFRHELDKWTSHVDNLLSDGYGGISVDNTNNANDNLVEHDYPTFDEGVTSADEVAAARMAEVLSWGFATHAITYDAMVDDPGYPDDYFVINYFTEAQYMGTDAANPTAGHIPGAFQFTPKKSLVIGTEGDAWEDMLKYVPTDKKVVVYCWTSQTSSQVAFYLNCLGYDAYSLKWGVNQLFHDELTNHKWVPVDHENDAYEPWWTPEG